MKRIGHGLFLVGFVVSTGMVFSIPAESADLTCNLEACVAYAAGNHPGIYAAKAKADAAVSQVLVERATYRPKLTGTGTTAWVKGEPVSYFSVIGVTEAEVLTRQINYRPAWSAGATFYYPLVHEGAPFGLGSPLVWAAEATATKEKFQAEVVSVDVLSVVRDAFAAYQNDLAQANLDQEYAKVTAEEVKIARSRRVQHLITEEELNETEQKSMTAEHAAARSATTVVNARRNLLIAIGGNESLNLNIVPEKPSLPVLPPLDQLLETALAGHPSLGVQKAAVEVAGAGVSLEKRGRIPTLDLESTFAYADDFHFPGSNLWVSLVKVSVPLFDFGSTSAKINHALAVKNQEERTLDDTYRQVRQNVVSSYVKTEEAVGEADAIALELSQADLALAVAEANAAQQRASPSTVLSAKEVVITKKKDLVKAYYSAHLQVAELRKAVGRDWNESTR